MCVEEGCDRPPTCRGMCNSHYQKWYHCTPPEQRGLAPTQINKILICTIQGCDRSHKARGWCDRHWNRWKKWGDPLLGRDKSATCEYFRAHLGEEGEGCLIWPFGTSQPSGRGYGRVSIDGVAYSVARLACEHRWGPPPSPGMDVAHLPLVCHNRLCWRGAHLRWATRLENVADMELDGTAIRGEARWNSRLTTDEVVAIRIAYAQGDVLQATLAEQYGVTKSLVGNIIRGRCWKHVGGPITHRNRSKNTPGRG